MRMKMRSATIVSMIGVVTACTNRPTAIVPGSAETRPEAGVYAAMLDSLHRADKGEILLRDSTVTFPRAASLEGASPRDSTLWRDLVSESARRRSVTELAIPRVYRTLGLPELREIFRGGPIDGWSDFARRFPAQRGFFELSPVVFGDDGRSAAFYYQYYCGGLCGSGDAILERRGADGRWHVERVIRHWVS